MSLPNVTAIQKRGRKGGRKERREERARETFGADPGVSLQLVSLSAAATTAAARRSVLYFLASFISDTAINASRPATQQVEHNAPFTIAAAAAAASLEDSTLSRGCNVKHGKNEG